MKEARQVATQKKNPADERFIRTASGHWSKDQSGLWHYKNDRADDVTGAVHNALREPAPGPAWFWFNDTPVPIYAGDTDQALVQRWRHWLAMIQHNEKLLLSLLAVLPRE